MNRLPSLPGKEFLVLDLLAAKPAPAYGLELVRRSQGDLSRGSVYVLLDRLEEKGFVESWLEDKPEDRSGLPRRLYRLTATGARARSAAAAASAVWAGPTLQVT